MNPLRLAWHRLRALFAAIRYGFPARKLTVIGVTGTDGKTTTVGMVAHILNANGMKTGALSTAFFQIGNEITWNATQKTSPSPFIVQRFLRELVNQGCTHAVLEYSSHGLMQGRLDWTWPKVAAITNLSEEHLDYHKTMEEYARAKSLLFKKLKGRGVKVLNADDRTFEMYRNIGSEWSIFTSTKRSFGRPEHDHECAIWATNVSTLPGSVSASLNCNVEPNLQNLELPIAGAFNIENALTAIGAAHGVMVNVHEAINALQTFKGVPGRIERIDEGQDFSVYVDFTVTPKSYESTLTTIRSTLSSGTRLLVLTGSCGDRMKEKRPIVGNLCGTLADIVVVTNEDPYTEDPEKIIDEVLSGIPKEKQTFRDTSDVPSSLNNYCVRLSDRLVALRYLLRIAKKGDAILFAGKGSDTTMMLKTGQIPWNEREIVRSELRAIRSK